MSQWSQQESWETRSSWVPSYFWDLHCSTIQHKLEIKNWACTLTILALCFLKMVILTKRRTFLYLQLMYKGIWDQWVTWSTTLIILSVFAGAIWIFFQIRRLSPLQHLFQAVFWDEAKWLRYCTWPVTSLLTCTSVFMWVSVCLSTCTPGLSSLFVSLFVLCLLLVLLFRPL